MDIVCTFNTKSINLAHVDPLNNNAVIEGFHGTKPVELSQSATHNNTTLPASNPDALIANAGVDVTIELCLDHHDEPLVVAKEIALAESFPRPVASSFASLLSCVVEEARRLSPPPPKLQAPKSRPILSTWRRLLDSDRVHITKEFADRVLCPSQLAALHAAARIESQLESEAGIGGRSSADAILKISSLNDPLASARTDPTNLAVDLITPPRDNVSSNHLARSSKADDSGRSGNEPSERGTGFTANDCAGVGYSAQERYAAISWANAYSSVIRVPGNAEILSAVISRMHMSTRRLHSAQRLALQRLQQRQTEEIDRICRDEAEKAGGLSRVSTAANAKDAREDGEEEASDPIGQLVRAHVAATRKLQEQGEANARALESRQRRTFRDLVYALAESERIGVVASLFKSGHLNVSGSQLSQLFGGTGAEKELASLDQLLASQPSVKRTISPALAAAALDATSKLTQWFAFPRQPPSVIDLQQSLAGGNGTLTTGSGGSTATSHTRASRVLCYKQLFLGSQRRSPFIVSLEIGDIDVLCAASGRVDAAIAATTASTLDSANAQAFDPQSPGGRSSVSMTSQGKLSAEDLAGLSPEDMDLPSGNIHDICVIAKQLIHAALIAIENFVSTVPKTPASFATREAVLSLVSACKPISIEFLEALFAGEIDWTQLDEGSGSPNDDLGKQGESGEGQSAPSLQACVAEQAQLAADVSSYEAMLKEQEDPNAVAAIMRIISMKKAKLAEADAKVAALIRAQQAQLLVRVRVGLKALTFAQGVYTRAHKLAHAKRNAGIFSSSSSSNVLQSPTHPSQITPSDELGEAEAAISMARFPDPAARLFMTLTGRTLKYVARLGLFVREPLLAAPVAAAVLSISSMQKLFAQSRTRDAAKSQALSSIESSTSKTHFSLSTGEGSHSLYDALNFIRIETDAITSIAEAAREVCHSILSDVTLHISAHTLQSQRNPSEVSNVADNVFGREPTGIIVPIDADAILGTGPPSHRWKALSDACSVTSELHFLSLSEQLTQLRRRVKSTQTKISLGDVVTTVHSNLPFAQIAMHLTTVGYFTPKDLESFSLAEWKQHPHPSLVTLQYERQRAKLFQQEQERSKTQDKATDADSLTKSGGSGSNRLETVLMGLRQAVLMADLRRIDTLAVPMLVSAHTDHFQQAIQVAKMALTHQRLGNNVPGLNTSMSSGSGVSPQVGSLSKDLAIEIEGVLSAVRGALNALVAGTSDTDRSIRHVRLLIPARLTAWESRITAYELEFEEKQRALEQQQQAAARSGRSQAADVETGLAQRKRALKQALAEADKAEAEELQVLSQLPLIQDCVKIFQSVWG